MKPVADGEVAEKEVKNLDRKMQRLIVGARIEQRWAAAEGKKVTWHKGEIVGVDGEDIQILFDGDDEDSYILSKTEIREDFKNNEFKLTPVPRKKRNLRKQNP